MLKVRFEISAISQSLEEEINQRQAAFAKHLSVDGTYLILTLLETPGAEEDGGSAAHNERVQRNETKDDSEESSGSEWSSASSDDDEGDNSPNDEEEGGEDTVARTPRRPRQSSDKKRSKPVGPAESPKIIVLQYGERLMVGRRGKVPAGNDRGRKALELLDPFVSGCHLEVAHSPERGGFCIRDPGSMNGTFLQRVKDFGPEPRGRLLREGMLICIGGVELRIVRRSVEDGQAEALEGGQGLAVKYRPRVSVHSAAASLESSGRNSTRSTLESSVVLEGAKDKIGLPQALTAQRSSAILRKPRLASRELPLDKTPGARLVIGSSPDCDIVLPEDGGVTRPQHAVITTHALPSLGAAHDVWGQELAEAIDMSSEVFHILSNIGLPSGSGCLPALPGGAGAQHPPPWTGFWTRLSVSGKESAQVQLQDGDLVRLGVHTLLQVELRQREAYPAEAVHFPPMLAGAATGATKPLLPSKFYFRSTRATSDSLVLRELGYAKVRAQSQGGGGLSGRISSHHRGHVPASLPSAGSLLSSASSGTLGESPPTEPPGLADSPPSSSLEPALDELADSPPSNALGLDGASSSWDTSVEKRRARLNAQDTDTAELTSKTNSPHGGASGSVPEEGAEEQQGEPTRKEQEAAASLADGASGEGEASVAVKDVGEALLGNFAHQHEMQDRTLCVNKLGDDLSEAALGDMTGCALWGVFDGHASRTVADFVSCAFAENLRTDLCFLHQELGPALSATAEGRSSSFSQEGEGSDRGEGSKEREDGKEEVEARRSIEGSPGSSRGSVSSLGLSPCTPPSPALLASNVSRLLQRSRMQHQQSARAAAAQQQQQAAAAATEALPRTEAVTAEIDFTQAKDFMRWQPRDTMVTEIPEEGEDPSSWWTAVSPPFPLQTPRQPMVSLSQPTAQPQAPEQQEANRKDSSQDRSQPQEQQQQPNRKDPSPDRPGQRAVGEAAATAAFPADAAPPEAAAAAVESAASAALVKAESHAVLLDFRVHDHTWTPPPPWVLDKAKWGSLLVPSSVLQTSTAVAAASPASAAPASLAYLATSIKRSLTSLASSALASFTMPNGRPAHEQEERSGDESKETESKTHVFSAFARLSAKFLSPAALEPSLSSSTSLSVASSSMPAATSSLSLSTAASSPHSPAATAASEPGRPAAHPLLAHALRRTFARTCLQLEGLGEGSMYAGSTALVCVLWRNTWLYTANLGDSRAVLCRGGKAVVLSYDHVVKDAAEKELIIQRGGKVGRNNKLGYCLALSRALGDRSLHQYGLSTEPFISEVLLGRYDELLLLASDGVWDVFSSQQGVDFVRELIYHPTSPLSAQEAAQQLLLKAQQKKSQDNLSAVVVLLRELPCG
eukprot:g30255.t1